MTVSKVYHKYRNVTFHIHQANKRLIENYVRQRALIHAQNQRQLADERAAVRNRINHMHSGVQQAFLRMRLAHIERQMQMNDE